MPPPSDEDANEDDAAGREGEFRGFFPYRPRPKAGLAVTVASEVALVSSSRRHGKYVVVLPRSTP